MADTYLTRQTLLKKLKQKDNHLAWEEFSNSYKVFIENIILKMGINQNDSADLRQEVLLKLWEKLPAFNYNQQQGKFRSWLYKVTQNIVMQYFRRHNYRSKQNELFIKTAEGTYVSPEIEKLMEEQWQKHILEKAYKTIKEKLSERAMDAFQSGLENEPVEETAKRLNISEKTVYVYRMRVKNSLYTEIENLRELLE